MADTEMLGDGPWLNPCFPLWKFPAFPLMTSSPLECPFSPLHPPHALLCPPARSLAATPRASPQGPALPPALVTGIAMAELVPASLSPLQPPLHAAAEPLQGRPSRAGSIAAEIKSHSPALKFSLRCKSSGISKLTQAGTRSCTPLGEGIS